MDKIYIKNEDGKEVAYKTGWFDTEIKIGELHERSDGSKETRNIGGGENVTIGGPNSFGDRKGSVSSGGIFSLKSDVESKEGIFSRESSLGIIRDYPVIFNPSKVEEKNHSKSSPSHICDNDSFDHRGSYNNSSSQQYINLKSLRFKILVGLAALVSGFLIYSMRTTELKEKERMYATQRTISNDNLEHTVGQEEQPIHLYDINFVYSYYESSNFCLMDGNLYNLDKNNRIFLKSLDHVLFVLHHFPVEEERAATSVGTHVYL